MNQTNREKPKSQFFHTARGDAIYLIALLLFVAGSFLPWWRRIHVAGMALFGWLMAVLMFTAPLIAFIRYLRRRKAGDSGSEG